VSLPGDFTASPIAMEPGRCPPEVSSRDFDTIAAIALQDEIIDLVRRV
jgi:hypothetical protein